MRAKTTRPTTTGANPQRVHAEMARRRSNAAGSHDTRPHRQRSRTAARTAAIKESR